jgi:hypothetical protein
MAKIKSTAIRTMSQIISIGGLRSRRIATTSAPMARIQEMIANMQRVIAFDLLFSVGTNGAATFPAEADEASPPPTLLSFFSYPCPAFHHLLVHAV